MPPAVPSGGTTTTGLLTRVITSSAVRPAGRGPPCRPRAPRTTATTSASRRRGDDRLDRRARGLAQLDVRVMRDLKGGIGAAVLAHVQRGDGGAEQQAHRPGGPEDRICARAGVDGCEDASHVGSFLCVVGDRSNVRVPGPTSIAVAVRCEDGDRWRGGDVGGGRGDAHADATAAEAHTQLERVQAGHRDRVDRQAPVPRVAGRAKPNASRPPDAAHRRQVQAAGRRLADVVEVDAGREAQQRERLARARPARASSAAWTPGDSELPCAVRGS